MSFQIRLPALLATLVVVAACGDGAMPLAPEMAVASPAATAPVALLRTSTADREAAVAPQSESEEGIAVALESSDTSDSAALPSGTAPNEPGASDAPVREEEDVTVEEQQPFAWLGIPMPLLSGYMLSSGRKAPQQ